MMLIGLLLAALVASWVMTRLLRHYALAKSLMDIPNERSSHTMPTPRGGGVAIVLGFALSVPFLAGIESYRHPALYHVLVQACWWQSSDSPTITVTSPRAGVCSDTSLPLPG